MARPLVKRTTIKKQFCASREEAERWLKALPGQKIPGDPEDFIIVRILDSEVMVTKNYFYDAKATVMAKRTNLSLLEKLRFTLNGET